MKKKEKSSRIEEIQLEATTEMSMPNAPIQSLFSSELAGLSSKLMVYENLFRLLVTQMPFKDFCREILTVLVQAVPSEAGAVLELDYDQNSIFFRAAIGHASDQVSSFVIPMGKGIVGFVAESRTMLLVSNANDEQKHLKSIANSVGFEVRNMLALPLVIRGKTFAVIELLNRVGQDGYSEADLQLFQQLGFVLSRALEIRMMLTWTKNQGQAA